MDAVYLILLRLPGVGCGGKRHVDGIYIMLLLWVTLQSVELIGSPNTRGLSAQASRRTERVRRCACVPCAHASPLCLNAAGASPPCYTAQEGKAPCAWRTPPPHPGQVPILPVCKSYQRRKKRPAVYPPPSRGRPRYYPYAKVISSAQSDPRSQMVQALG